MLSNLPARQPVRLFSRIHSQGPHLFPNFDFQTNRTILWRCLQQRGLDKVSVCHYIGNGTLQSGGAFIWLLAKCKEETKRPI